MTIRQTDIKRIKALTKAIETRQRSRPTMPPDEAAAAYERSLDEAFSPCNDGSPRILTTHTVEEAALIYHRYVEGN